MHFPLGDSILIALRKVAQRQHESGHGGGKKGKDVKIRLMGLGPTNRQRQENEVQGDDVLGLWKSFLFFLTDSSCATVAPLGVRKGVEVQRHTYVARPVETYGMERPVKVRKSSALWAESDAFKTFHKKPCSCTPIPNHSYYKPQQVSKVKSL